MHRCPDCWHTTRTIADLNRHIQFTTSMTSDDVAAFFSRMLNYSQTVPDEFVDEITVTLESEQGYLYHGRTVWLRPMPETIVVWEGNDIDPDMNKVAELPLIYS